MLRNVPGHGQHRTFPRFGHGGLRLSGSRRQRLRQNGGIQTPGRCHLRGETIHELAEDDSGIAPRSGQGSLRGPGPDGSPGIVRTRTADSLHDRLQRQCQVGTGIAVGDRKHVFAVQPLLVPRNPSGGRTKHADGHVAGYGSCLGLHRGVH